METIFQFQTRDLVSGLMVTQPVKSTAERIGRIPGAVIVKGSGESVAESSVDSDGRRKFHA